MSNLTTLKSAHLKQYNAAQAASFYGSLKKAIDNAGRKNLGISQNDYDSFVLNYNQLSDAVNATHGSDKTALINSYDEERDKYFRYVRNVFSNLKNSTDSELAALYATAKAKILNVYPASIATEAKQEETAHIVGFIIDVRNFFGESLSKLGIASALTSLETANANFLATTLDRSDELANQVEKATETYRAALEQIYARFELTINYNAAQTEADDEATVMLQSACANFIALFNEYIDELWQTIKLSKALTKKKDDKTNTSGGNSSSNGGTSTGGSTTGGNTSGGSSNSGSNLPTLGA